MSRNPEPSARVKSAEGRATGADVPGASEAMKVLARDVQRRDTAPPQPYKEPPWPEPFRQWLPTGRITAEQDGARGPGRAMWFGVVLRNQYGDRIGRFETTTSEDRAAFIAAVNGSDWEVQP